MQIECYSEESITFKITNSDGDNAVDTFNSVMKKCRATALKKGFNNMFSSEEKAFLKEFTDKVLDNEVGY